MEKAPGSIFSRRVRLPRLFFSSSDAGQDLLGEARRIAGHRVEALLHVDPVEFLVALVVAHDDLPAAKLRSAAL